MGRGYEAAIRFKKGNVLGDWASLRRIFFLNLQAPSMTEFWIHHCRYVSTSKTILKMKYFETSTKVNGKAVKSIGR